MDPEDKIKLPIIAVNLITAHILLSVHPQDTSSRKLDQLRKSTVQDNQLTRLSRYINTGFPCEKKNLLTDLQEYWNYRDTLSIENGLLTCGSRIIVPQEMQAGCYSTSTMDIRVKKDAYWEPEIQYFGQRSHMTFSN